MTEAMTSPDQLEPAAAKVAEVFGHYEEGVEGDYERWAEAGVECARQPDSARLIFSASNEESGELVFGLFAHPEADAVEFVSALIWYADESRNHLGLYEDEEPPEPVRLLERIRFRRRQRAGRRFLEEHTYPMCCNCEHFRTSGRTDDPHEGECHFDPPAADHMWPLVNQGDSCGKFTPPPGQKIG